MANPQKMNGVASLQPIYQTSTVQQERIGTRGVLDDRSFRYARMSGTAIATNVLCQAAVVVANHTSQSGALSTQGVTAGGIPIGASAFTATVGATAGDINQYEDGYLKVQSGTGAGQIYKMQRHAAFTSAQVAAPFELYDPVVTAIASGAVWAMIRNPWADVIITPVTTQTNINVGVPLVALPTGTAAAPVYAWLQTWGICSVLGDTTDLVAGSGIIGQGATAGTVALEAAGTITQRAGFAFASLATDNVHQTVFLTIAP